MTPYDHTHPIHTISGTNLPPLIKHVNDPPAQLFIRGTFDKETTFLCVVGSRRSTAYGKEACETLVKGLQGYNITIISGLALGIDEIAHESALKASLPTIAIPGSGLSWDTLYPRKNIRLAERILDAGGALISEEVPDFIPRPYSFPKRNRIMAGMSHAVLVIECDIQSGTLITSKYATDYNRDVFAVPGSIFSKRSEGPHMLLRLGATPIRTSADIIDALGLGNVGTARVVSDTETYQKKLLLCTQEECAVLELLEISPATRDKIIRTLSEKNNLSPSSINSLLMMLEMKGFVVERMGEMHRV